MVCDGVGGWTEVDERPDLVSLHTVAEVNRLYANREAEKENDFDLREILVESIKTNEHVGSTTAVIAAFEGETDGKTA
jgi:hypothetical protein